MDLKWPPCACAREVHETVGCPIPHFSVQKGARERLLCGRYAPSIRTSAEPALGRADFYPTVKAELHHESADSEKDSKGLGCHLGHGWMMRASRRVEIRSTLWY